MRFFGCTDMGRVRKDNQDTFDCREIPGLGAVLVVCDGMGGAQAGSVASTTAVNAFYHALEDSFSEGIPAKADEREEDLARACRIANMRVYDLARDNWAYDGMGTTLVAALVLPDVAHVVNVGDSRCYLLSNGMIRQVTVDHSLVQLLVDRGEITPEEAQHHPKKNLITRAVGVDLDVDCDILRVELGQGDRLLLCSDGLTNVLSNETIAEESRKEPDLERLGHRLMDMTLERGAPDNVTVVLAEI